MKLSNSNDLIKIHQLKRNTNINPLSKNTMQKSISNSNLVKNKENKENLISHKFVYPLLGKKQDLKINIPT